MDYVWIIEINSFCALLLGIILYSLCINFDRQTKQRYYMRAIIMGIFSCLADINWALIEGHFIDEPPICNFLTNGLYCVFSIIMGYNWLCYVETALETKIFKNTLFRALMKLPVGIVVVGVLVSYYNGVFFYINDDNVYCRGPLILVHTVLCHLYTITTSVHAFIKACRVKNYLKSVEYRILSMFLLFPLAIGIIQIFFPNIPTVSVGITLSFLFVYIDLQNLLISIDTLTGLNNRNQIIRYLGSRIKGDNENRNLYVFMLDVNKFKKINDTFGHVEGDAALIRCAEALKKANKYGRNFIGRYGGDEFIVIADIDEPDEIEEYCQRIHDALQRICIDDHVPYDLSFSIGCARYDKSMKTIQSFISEADIKLYEAKRRRDGLMV